MLNLSKSITVYQGVSGRKNRSQLFICEWQTIDGEISDGIFLIDACHFLEAKQTAKKILRDELISGRQFQFDIRTPTPEETQQITKILSGESVETNTLAGPIQMVKKIFAGIASAISPNKTDPP